MLNINYSVAIKMDGDLSLVPENKPIKHGISNHTKRGMPRVKIFMDLETGVFLCEEYIPI